ncbi:MAG: DUF2179 domain-containing protein [Mycoplasmatota bacterium]
MLMYVVIFLSKILEIALGTIRLIYVANGKKIIGAILQFIISIVWISVTGVVIVDIATDPLKIFFYAFGSLIGSYLGSYLEEKLAVGSNMLMSIVDESLGEVIVNCIREHGYAVTVIDGQGKEKGRKILMIMVSRKQRRDIVSMIKNIDKNAMIISENATTIVGGYTSNGKHI